MNSRFYIKFLILFAVILYANNLFPAGTIGQSGADFLEIGVGSRPLGMGEAFCAEINDINSIYYNPAGLGSMTLPILSVQHQELILDSRYQNISFCYPMYGGFLGISNSIFWVPGFDKINIDGDKVGDVKYLNGNFTGAYGYDLGFMYVGGSIKYIYQKIDTLFVNSFAVDIGVLKGLYMYSPFDAPTRNFHIGLAIQNLGTKAKGDPLPRLIRLGVSYKLTRWFGLNIDFTENIIDISDLYDFAYGFNESFRMNIGVEFNYLEILYLRGGYRLNDGGTYSIGFGFNYVIKNVSFIIDASFSDSGIFGPSYSINISFMLIPRVITIQDRRNAEFHYQKGIQHFVSNEIDDAIQEFKVSKDYNPYHKNIDEKIEDLNEILKLQKENIELDDELKKID